MPEIIYKTASGEIVRVAANEGDSIMEAAVRQGVPGIIGECGGGMSCATCHIYVAPPWKERLWPASEDEVDLLEFEGTLTDESRLGCQIKTSTELDGIEVQIP